MNKHNIQGTTPSQTG